MGNIPVFFSQCPKFRLILGIGNASFCFMPKISRLFEFFPEKTKIFGYWRKKAAYIPNLVIRTPTPYPPQKRKYAKKSRPADQISSLPGGCPFILFSFQTASASGQGAAPVFPSTSQAIILPPEPPLPQKQLLLRVFRR